MDYYFAPMEGLTDSIYRRLHHSFFPGLDRYYTPFLSPTVHRKLTAKEERELPPAERMQKPWRHFTRRCWKNTWWPSAAPATPCSG